jgi:hypothetical protein
MTVFDDDVVRVRKPAVPASDTAAGEVSRIPSLNGPRSAAAVLQLQRLAGNGGVAQLLQSDDDAQLVRRGVSGGGSPLDTTTRVQMEQALGTDLSSVRVHTDGAAADSAKSLGAHAYTVGDDVVFGQGKYEPASDTGQRTLAHELTHVVQQRSGPVEGTPTGGGINLSDPNDRFERAAESNADAIMSGQRAVVDGSSASAPAVQRQDEEEDEVQALAVQREGGEEDDLMSS